MKALVLNKIDLVNNRRKLESLDKSNNMENLIKYSILLLNVDMEFKNSKTI